MRYGRLTVAHAAIALILTLCCFDFYGQRFAVETCGWTEGDSVAVVPCGTVIIPDFAFADCKSLSRVIFSDPDSLVEIGEYAFLGCDSLRDIELPRSLRRLGTGCFMECWSLASLDVPESVTVLPRYFAAWCSRLESVSLPPGLKDIGSHAFAYCGRLMMKDVPYGVKHIGSNAWSLCRSLEEMYLPDTVEELESYAFSDCTSLIRVRLPANPHMLGELLFSGCDSIEEIEEESEIPPMSDCGSPLFDPDRELPTTLRVLVPSSSLQQYKRSDLWSRLPLHGSERKRAQ